MHAADSVAISRLQVKGDKRTSQALVRELEQASWPLLLPAHLQHAWVLVREIQVTGRARDLRRHTAKQLDSELQSAVRAISGNSANANAIWFASLPELIAFLSIELALGKTSQWYWSRWAYLLRYPRQEAIARLLCEYCEYLPAIFAQLQTQRQLGSVWAQLSDGSAKAIARELSKAWHLPAFHTWQAEVENRHTDNQPIRQGLQAQKKLHAVWKPLLEGLALKDGRVTLAAIIYGLTYTPLWLQQTPAAFIQLFASILPASTPPAQTSPITRQSREPLGGDNKPAKKQELFFNKKSAEPLQRSVNDKAGPGSTPAIAFSSQNTPEQQKHSRVNAGEADAVVLPASQENAQKKSLRHTNNQHPGSVTRLDAIIENHVEPQEFYDGPTPSAAYEFTTQSGGFFYLLNPLSRLLTAERLAGQQEASVWHWLLDLYRLFAQRFPALDGCIDPPLLRFILQQMHPGATPVELPTLSQQAMASPPADFAKALFADLHQRFGATSSWRELESSPGFFATPARVLATASHWDIYFPLASVRLEVRLAGWDINPGWLPWLGRVISFHYVEQPVPTGPGAAS
jgi:hypothetical protein